MKDARYYTSLEGNHIRCNLCPHQCTLSEGESGKCKVRINSEGLLKTFTYGNLSSIALDPVEKKPLYHYYPGQQILSIGSFGCTMHCEFCQNSSISQCEAIKPRGEVNNNPADIVQLTKAKQCNIIAFTYNEPVVFYEFMFDIAVLSHEAGINTAVVSNGFIQEKPLKDLIPYISAFNIDVKSYDNEFYRKFTGARLGPVLKALGIIAENSRHLEITYLLIPGINDDPLKFNSLCKQLKDIAGKELVVHISRYFPRYKMTLPPTPVETLMHFVDIARSEFYYVYPGNVGPDYDANTYCPGCSTLIIRRSAYRSSALGVKDGRCENCGEIIYGKF